MEVRVQIPYSGISEQGKWTPGRRSLTSGIPSPLPLVSNTVKVVSNRPTSDFTLRDKTKLLQLADRIQTKKISNPNVSIPTTPAQQNSKWLNGTDKEGLGSKSIPVVKIYNSSTPTKIYQLANRSGSELSGMSSGLQKAGTSFRRSKLYASFSPTKRSLLKLAKTDPTKTNIEHLVNHRNHRSCEIENSNSNFDQLPPVGLTKASFHDSEKLSSVFSNHDSPRVKLFQKSLIPVQKFPVKGNNIKSFNLNNTTDDNCHQGGLAELVSDNSSRQGQLVSTQPKISSAQIIPLTSSKNYKVQLKKYDRVKISEPETVHTSYHDEPIINKTEVEVEFETLAKEFSNTTTNSSYHDFHREFTQPTSFPTKQTFSPSAKGQNTKNNFFESTMSKLTHKPLSSSVSYNSFFGGDMNLNNDVNAVETTDHYYDYRHMKRSHSLPKSFFSVRKGLKHVNLSLLPIRFWTRENLGFKKLLNTNERRMTVGQIYEDRTTNTNSSIKMKLEKREGRPMSFDYAQRKAWMRVYRDMEVSQAVATLSSDSEPQQPIRKGSSGGKDKPIKNLSITHLHLLEQQQTHHLRHQNSESTDTCSVESGGCDSISIKSTTPSLFQRFSKTFSLRFGNSTNPKQKISKKEERYPSSSSPDIYGGIRLVESTNKSTIIDPSSGKIRKGLRKSSREDKCQSGDSGIQLEEEVPGRFLRGGSKKNSAEFESMEYRHSQSSSSASPISMKKLSLVEIPNGIWDSDGDKREEDAGFVSSNEEDGVDERVVKYGTVAPKAYYHSLPLKYSRQRKAELLLEKKKESIRGNVVREILTTEQNYVKSLNDIVQGFLIPCRARTDLFSDKTVHNIFSNIDEILRLHLRIFESLKTCVESEDYARSRIGHIFQHWADHFDLYSEYCYQNPMAMATVRQLTLNYEYAEFFEACRRLQLMDKLPLHGFLLRPIQRICQYHLQLNELLKHTATGHEDYENVEAALATMKDVAMKINDTQRKFDSLQEIVRIQSSIDGWEGPDLVPGNSVLLHKADLVKMKQGHKYKETHLILLNNELIVCRKDSYKKGTISLDCRLPMCSTAWVNIDSNEEDDYFGMVHNSWRVFNPHDGLWTLFIAPSPPEKQKWMIAFEKTNLEYPVDSKMSEMAKVTAIKLMLTETQSQNTQMFTANSTLPRLRKNRKSSSLTKSDSDAMLIEVGKLRKSSHFPQSQILNFNNQSDESNRRNSKFYV